MSLFHELKRRKVFRVAVVYAATAFAVLQGADILLPNLGVPGWVMRFVIVVVLLGFPIALVLAWALEVTPEGGVKRTADARNADIEQAPSLLGVRTVFVAGLLVAVGIGLSAGWLLKPAGGSQQDTGSAAGAGSVPGAAGAASTDTRPSIAVLPFDNLAGDEATEPFVLGVHDDLLTQLSRIEALRVISRTSVLEYRGSPKNVRQIAAELGVSVVLEGGVQRVGDRVRLNVQLIDAASDAHIWAETYERELTAENVFAIQADIARSVMSSLRAELAPAEIAELDVARTSNLAALEAYHTARAAFLDGGTRRDDVAPLMFERAVALDSTFADAWAGLSMSRSWFVRQLELPDSAPALEALERARGLAPDRIETRLAEAIFHYYGRADLPRALESFEALLRDAPGDLGILQGLASVERRLGRMQEAAAHFEEAARLDPRSGYALADLAETVGWLRDIDRARELLERALRISPEHEPANLSMFGVLLWQFGDTAAAVRFARESVVGDPSIMAAWEAELALVRRDYPSVLHLDSALDEDASGGFSSYGGFYTKTRSLLLAKAAWLADDADLVERWTASALAIADSLLEVGVGAGDAWGRRSFPELRRALALGFRGDTAAALEAAGRAARMTVERDALEGAQMLDHLVVVDIVTGRHDRAIDRIQRLLSLPSQMTRVRLRLDPIYDPLRADPRFQALLQP
jgi:TolB-like protein/Flp pilus assembly protein TadD